MQNQIEITQQNIDRDYFEDEYTKYGDSKRLPKKEHFFSVITRDEITALLGRKWKYKLAQLKKVSAMYEHQLRNTYQIEIPIASTSTYLLSIFGSHDTVAKIIQNGIKIELLYCSNLTYSFKGKTSKKFRYSRKYIFNIALVRRLLSDEYKDIDTSIFKNKTYFQKTPNISTFDTRIKINSKLHHKNFGNGITNAEIIEQLCVRYPQLKEIENIITEINKTLPEELKQRFVPKIKRRKNKLISKITIRATSKVCSYKKSNKKDKTEKETENSKYTGNFREEYLEEYFKSKNHHKYDIKSSIFRVTLLLNTGVWEDDTVDIYAKMVGREFKDDAERKFYKNEAMKAYFDYSGKSIFNHMRRVEIGEHGDEIVRNTLLPLKEDFIKFYDVYIKNMYGVIGPGYDSEIFLHESAICALIHKELTSRGLKVVQVYDGFYFDKEVPDIQDIVKDAAMYYYDTYIMTTTIDKKTIAKRTWQTQKNSKKTA